MSQIQTGRFSNLMRRYLGMKGVTEVTPELAPEISPVFILESQRPEWEFLKNEKLMSFVFGGVGVAAQNAVARLRNPPGSGVVATITAIRMVTDTLSIGLVSRDDDQGNLVTVLPTVSRDTRLPVLNASVLIPSQGNGIVVTGESWWTNLAAANESVKDDVDFVLTEGNQLDFVSTTVNSSLRGFCWWRERRLDVLEAE